MQSNEQPNYAINWSFRSGVWGGGLYLLKRHENPFPNNGTHAGNFKELCFEEYDKIIKHPTEVEFKELSFLGCFVCTNGHLP